MKERRQKKRFMVEQMIDIEFDREFFIQAEGINLSESGILCRSPFPIEPMTRMYMIVELKCPKGRYLLKTEGIVIHTEQRKEMTLFGVEFIALTRADKMALALYLDGRQTPATVVLAA